MKHFQEENPSLLRAKQELQRFFSEYNRRITPEMSSRIHTEWAKAIGLDPTGGKALALVEKLREKFSAIEASEKEQTLTENIVKVKDGYRLVSRKSGRNLGTFDSMEKARDRERQVNYFAARDN